MDKHEKEDKLNRIISRYGNLIEHECTKWCLKLKLEYSEVYQTIMIAIYESIEKLDEDKCGNFIITMCRNCSTNHLNKEVNGRFLNYYFLYQSKYKKLYDKLNRKPTKEEVMQYLKIKERTYKNYFENKLVLCSFNDESISSDIIKIELKNKEDIEDILIDKDRQKAFYKIIKTLPDDKRTVFYLKYFNNLSYDEIARYVGSTPKSVDNKIQWIKRTLSKKLLNNKNFREYYGDYVEVIERWILTKKKYI